MADYTTIEPGEWAGLETEIYWVTQAINSLASVDSYIANAILNAGSSVASQVASVAAQVGRQADVAANLAAVLPTTVLESADRITGALDRLAQGDLANLSDNVWLTARAVENFSIEQLEPFLAILALILGKPGPGLGDIPLETIYPGANYRVKPLGEIVEDAATAIAASTDASSPDLKENPNARLSFAGWLLGGAGDQAADLLKELVTNLVKAAIPALLNLVGTIVEAGHGPIADGITPRLQTLFETYRTVGSGTGAMTPESTTELALAAFQQAFAFGTEAHVYAACMELFHPSKELGLGGLAAGLADGAAFGPVMSNTLGRRLSVGLGRASEWAARKDFRTVWASIMEYERAFLKERISADVFRGRLQFEGWQDFEIDAYLGDANDPSSAVPYHHPRPADLAWIYEDVTTPDAWIYNSVIRAGFARPDADMMVKGLRRRSMRTLRSSYITELVSQFVAGRMPQDELTSHLTALDLRAEAVQLITDRANLQLSERLAARMLTTWTSLVDVQAMTPEAFKAAAAALGYTPAHISTEMARLDARAKGRAWQAEAKEHEAQILALQALIGTEYADRVRRGLSTPEELTTALVQAGMDQAQATALGQIAAVRQQPVLKLPEAMTPAAETQRVDAILADNVLLLVKYDKTDNATAVSYLVSLGMDQAEAAARVDLARAQGTVPKGIAPSAPLSPEQRLIRTNKVDAAVALFKAGDIGPDQFTGLLTAAGLTADEAASWADRETMERLIKQQNTVEAAAKATTAAAAKATADAAKAADAARAKTMAEVQTVLQGAILDSYKAGELPDAEAATELVAAGMDNTLATATIARSAAALGRKVPGAKVGAA